MQSVQTDGALQVTQPVWTLLQYGQLLLTSVQVVFMQDVQTEGEVQVAQPVMNEEQVPQVLPFRA